MLTKLVSAFGTLLVLGGLALLGYVGWSYTHPQPAAAPSGWSATDQKAGRQIADRYGSRQTITISGNLAHGIPAAGVEPATRMIIPKIGLNARVVQTAPVNGEWDVADWAVGHLTTTPNPGAVGNAAYSAHDDIKGELFKRVNELRPGDKIILRTAHASYTYLVTGQLTVDPTDTNVLNPTAKSTVTLISCVPYWVDTQRLIVQAILKSVTSA